MDLSNQVAFLEAHGAKTTGHADRDLMSHLLGVERMLASWGARRSVRLAGLFHSVYGTESFRTTLIPLGLRSEVERIVGKEPEELAYIFGAHEKTSFAANKGKTEGFSLDDRFNGQTISISPQLWTDFCEIFLANALEQISRVSPDRQSGFLNTYKWVCQYSSESAKKAYNQQLASIGLT